MKPEHEPIREERLAALLKEEEKIKNDLNEILGEGKWAIGPDGAINHKYSDLELVNLGKNVPAIVQELNQKLKKIYQERQEIEKTQEKI